MVCDTIIIGDRVIELIDCKSLKKMVSMILCFVQYMEDKYVIYGIKREYDEVNLFVSKVVKNSGGVTLDDNFSNGEKEILEDLVKKILSKTEKELLEQKGFVFFQDISFEIDNYFDIEKCYVTTVSSGLVKDCLIYYGLVRPDMLERPMVGVVESKKKFSEGAFGNLVFIVFGILFVVFCLIILYGVFFG